MKKLSIPILTISAALFAGQAQAAFINVGGVVWDPNGFFDFTTNDTMIESVTNTVGGVLNGYAKITTLNGETNQNAFCPGCEITYTFTGFTLATNGPKFEWTGGTVNVYVDNTPNYNSLLASSAADGTLWLSLAGHTFTDGTYTGTLISDPTPAGAGIVGSGKGQLDVTGGLAATVFDTNTIGDALGGFADFLFTSSFQLSPNGCFLSDDRNTYCMFGSNDLQGDSVVPEPGSLALAGLGLLGLVATRRRKEVA